MREAGIFQKLPENNWATAFWRCICHPLSYNVWCLIASQSDPVFFSFLGSPGIYLIVYPAYYDVNYVVFILFIFMIYIYIYVYYNVETLRRMGEPGTFPAAKWHDFDHCILTMIVKTPSHVGHLKLKPTGKRKQRKQKIKQESKTIWIIALKTWSFWKPRLE